MRETKVIRELAHSSKRIGQLYPILVDCFDNIIDGEHRYSVSKNWKKMRLQHIKTEKDRLLVRIIGNACRRNMSYQEKSRLLAKLGKIYQDEGIELGMISHKIAEDAGMSYSWVVKYLPDDFKDSLQSLRGSAVARRAANGNGNGSELTVPPKEEILTVHQYSNTAFINIMVKRPFYNEFEKIAKEMNTTSIILITNILMSKLNELKRQKDRLQTPLLELPQRSFRSSRISSQVPLNGV